MGARRGTRLREVFQRPFSLERMLKPSTDLDTKDEALIVAFIGLVGSRNTHQNLIIRTSTVTSLKKFIFVGKVLPQRTQMEPGDGAVYWLCAEPAHRSSIWAVMLDIGVAVDAGTSSRSNCSPI